MKREGKTLVVLLFGSLPGRAGVASTVVLLESSCTAEASPSLCSGVVFRGDSVAGVPPDAFRSRRALKALKGFVKAVMELSLRKPVEVEVEAFRGSGSCE